MDNISDLLDRLTTLAAIQPCTAPRVDLLQLLTLAGLADTHSFSVFGEGETEPLMVDAEALQAMVWLARRGGFTRCSRGYSRW